METFFSDGKLWPGGGPYPHFLVQLGDRPQFCVYARAHHELFGRYP
ncbi:hypothetical protein [Streptacidiphilus sp. EB103A]